MRGPINRLAAWNRRVCEWAAGRLPHTRVNAFSAYEDTVLRAVVKLSPQTILDLGTGATCPYAGRLAEITRLVGVDISEELLRQNPDVRIRVVADAHNLPVATATADLVTSRSLLEHLSDTERFIAEAGRVLNANGQMVLFFAGRYAWFAIVNRVLGRRLARRLLFAVHPESRASGGHPAVYDKCTIRSIRGLLARHGYETVEVRAFYGTNYAYSFLPLFIVTSIYEIAIQVLRVRTLAASILIVAGRELSPSRPGGLHP